MSGLEVALLRRGDGREQAAVGLDVDQRRAVEAIEALDEKPRAIDLFQDDDRGADRVRPHRRAQRKRAMGLAVRGRALQHEVAAGAVEPVEDLQPLEALDAAQRRHPGLEHLDDADRPVLAALSRRFQPRDPGGFDAADEHKPGIHRRRRLDRHLVFPDFVFPHHKPAPPATTCPKRRPGRTERTHHRHEIPSDGLARPKGTRSQTLS